MGKRRKDNPFAPDIPRVMSPAEKAAAVTNRSQVALTGGYETNTIHIYRHGDFAVSVPFGSVLDYEAIAEQLRAKREKRAAELQSRKNAIDQYLLQSDEPLRSIISVHERGADTGWPSIMQHAYSGQYFTSDSFDESNGDCKACNTSQKREVPAEFRCLTVKGIYDWMQRNEAIVAHRATMSVLEVGAL